MRMNKLAFFVSVACFSGIALAQVDYFGFAPGATKPYSRALSCSANGQTVVGVARAADGWVKPMRWAQSTGLQLLTLTQPALVGLSWDVSTDGTVIVGEAAAVGAFRWENGVMEILPSLPGGPMISGAASGVTPDGSTACGGTYSSNGPEATIWKKGAAPYGLFGLHPTVKPSGATNITSAGVAIGVATVNGQNSEAFILQNNLVKALGDLPGGTHSSYANDCTPDGSVVVGYSYSGALPLAFCWTDSIGMFSLGVLPGAPQESLTTAEGISADGWRVVGNGTFDSSTSCENLAGVRAFVWDPIMGMQTLQDIVEEEQGAPLPGYLLVNAFDCSADGTYVVGEALKLSNCAREGYRAKIKPFCYADCDQSPGHKRTLDAFDFLCFIARFDQQDFYTDCDQNGEHDFFDLLCYINEFGKGCEP